MLREGVHFVKLVAELADGYPLMFFICSERSSSLVLGAAWAAFDAHVYAHWLDRFRSADGGFVFVCPQISSLVCFGLCGGLFELTMC